MRIESSAVNMSALSSYSEQNTKEESVRTWVGNERPDFENQTQKSQSVSQKSQSGTQKSQNGNQKSSQQINIQMVQVDTVELSKEAKALSNGQKTQASSVQSSDSDPFDIPDEDKQKLLLIQELLEALTGKKIKFYLPSDIKPAKNSMPDIDPAVLQRVQAAQAQRQGWGMEMDSSETHSEQQKLSFKSDGVVKTADGREINFSVDLNMSREFASQQNVSIREGDAQRKMDPLVINLDGNAPQLTNTKYSFDLDSDGKDEKISFVSPGSGFLALDLNGDGKVNNGSELFGPKSGDGFADLAKYDSDGNNWIDENDSIYKDLRIWTKDSNGNDKLLALGEEGVGAIYLGNIDTDFSMKDSANNLQGQVSKTGIFLKENGTAGTINHIDLAV